jgi:uncharacterized protein (TIGR00730 family)
LSADEARRHEREVAVFGSARLDERHPSWTVAAELGRRLAEAGFTVVTGGYGGLMEATARAAHAVGGRVIGVPMRAWEHLTPGEWNAELRWASDYPTRLGLLLRCDALVALDGGIGTLSELSLAWAMRQTESAAPALVLVGERWRRVVDTFRRELVIDDSDVALLHVVDTPAEAVAALGGSRAPRRVGGARG